MAEQIGLQRLTGLIAFARVASLGSYTAAARALSVSPSAISKSVQRLESELGLALISRTTRALTLTEAGRELHTRALNLLREVEELEQAATAVKGEPSGTLRIVAALPVGTHILAPRLAEFTRRYPNVTVDLRLADDFVDLIREGIDVALRVGTLGDARLIAKTLCPHRVGAFASPAYLAARGMPDGPEDLDGHDLVNFRFQSSGAPLRWPYDNGAHFREVRAALVMDTSEAVAAALVAGAGIGISPTYVAAPYVARGLLTPILPRFLVDRSTIVALWPESRRGNPAVRAFIAFLDEVFPSPTPWDTVVADA